jgi:hypothetical protein
MPCVLEPEVCTKFNVYHGPKIHLIVALSVQDLNSYASPLSYQDRCPGLKEAADIIGMIA